VAFLLVINPLIPLPVSENWYSNNYFRLEYEKTQFETRCPE
jgi:hypothetical protein